MGYWKEARAELDDIGDPTDGIDIEKEMKEAMMNVKKIFLNIYVMIGK